STLREEIDLRQVRERFLDIVQQILQPRSVSMWVRATAHDTVQSLPSVAGAEQDDRQRPSGAPLNERGAQPQTATTELAAHSRAVAPPGTGAAYSYAVTQADVDVADADPLIAYALSHPGAVETDRLQLESPAWRTLTAGAVEIVVPMA